MNNAGPGSGCRPGKSQAAEGINGSEKENVSYGDIVCGFAAGQRHRNSISVSGSGHNFLIKLNGSLAVQLIRLNYSRGNDFHYRIR